VPSASSRSPSGGAARPVRVCVVEQQPDAPAGLVGAWARRRGHEIEVLRAPALGAWPEPRRFGAVVALGSDRSVHGSPDPWIAAEVRFLRDAHEAQVPVLGLCFGGQALAAALGATVTRAPHVEIGWLELEVPAGGPVVAGPWFAWHEDAFSLPSGATPLARSAAGLQGFRLGTSTGLQFHPEVDPAIVARWIRDGGRALADEGIDAAALLERTAHLAPQAERRAMALFDALLPA
jgi:GMP synthase-like glutamine amidotransferase